TGNRARRSPAALSATNRASSSAVVGENVSRAVGEWSINAGGSVGESFQQCFVTTGRVAVYRPVDSVTSEIDRGGPARLAGFRRGEPLDRGETLCPQW